MKYTRQLNFCIYMNSSFKPLRLLISGLRLHMTAVPLATASVIYHKFFRENSLQQYDPYVRKQIFCYHNSSWTESIDIGRSRSFSLKLSIQIKDRKLYFHVYLWILLGFKVLYYIRTVTSLIGTGSMGPLNWILTFWEIEKNCTPFKWGIKLMFLFRFKKVLKLQSSLSLKSFDFWIALENSLLQNGNF